MVDGGWAPVYNHICESDQRWLQVRRQGVVLGDNIQCKISNEFLNSSRVSHIDRIYTLIQLKDSQQEKS